MKKRPDLNLQHQAFRACRLYGTCNANLCPLDPELDKRTWFIGDDVCNLPDYRQLPMI